MKYIILFLISSNAYADTAVWTGKFELDKETPYQNTYQCEYEVNGEKGYISQEGYCEKTIQMKRRDKVDQA